MAIGMSFLLAVQTVVSDEASYIDQVKRVLSWLPDETESVIVVRSPVHERGDEQRGQSIAPGGSAVALSPIRSGKFQQRLIKYSAALGAHSSCRFQAAQIDRATVQFAGCQLVLFHENVDTVADTLMQEMAAAADGTMEIGGHRVVKFRESLNRLDWVFFVCFPAPNTLVVATDEQYLRSLIARIEKPRKAPYFDDFRLESELTRHLGAPLFAMRRFKRPMLDLEISPTANGFFCHLVEQQEHKVAEITYLAGRGTTTRSVADLWRFFPPVSTHPQVTDLGGRAFQICHSVAEQEDWAGFVLLLIWRLGHIFG
jgi:hypothetical protein